MSSLSSSLRGTKINPLGKRRRLSTASYNYQVDLYIEVNDLFITQSGGSMSTAVNYVNALVTAANVVYEKEVSGDAGFCCEWYLLNVTNIDANKTITFFNPD